MEIRPEQECSLESHIMQHDSTLLLLSKIHPLVSIIVFKAWLIEVKPTHTHLSLSSAAFSASSSFCKAVVSLSWARSSSSSTSWMRLFREATFASAYIQDERKQRRMRAGGEDMNESSTFIHHKAQWTPHLDWSLPLVIFLSISILFSLSIYPPRYQSLLHSFLISLIVPVNTLWITITPGYVSTIKRISKS